MDRKLAKVITIDEIRPIDGADSIEVACWDGWEVVVKKEKHYVGEKAVAFEIDSFLPEREEFEFLRKSSFKQTQNLGNGFRLRTVKLRNQVSQGLVMSLEELGVDKEIPKGTDLTEALGVKKWEMPVPMNLRGEAKGYFPDFIKKTDQERIQNIDLNAIAHYTFETSLKLDGSSMTVYLHPETNEFGVCSRNIDLKVNEKNIKDNVFLRTAFSLELELKLKQIFDTVGYRLAIQGELVGPGIQGNSCNLTEHKFYVFDLWNIDEQKYVNPVVRKFLCIDFKLDHVPVLNPEQQINHLTKKNLLEMADDLPSPFIDGSLNIKIPEGIVFKSKQSSDTFKVISNKFLLKEK